LNSQAQDRSKTILDFGLRWDFESWAETVESRRSFNRKSKIAARVSASSAMKIQNRKGLGFATQDRSWCAFIGDA
jgi:hypothetical protein